MLNFKILRTSIRMPAFLVILRLPIRVEKLDLRKPRLSRVDTGHRPAVDLRLLRLSLKNMPGAQEGYLMGVLLTLKWDFTKSLKRF